jgi:hypothetical protein
MTRQYRIWNAIVGRTKRSTAAMPSAVASGDTHIERLSTGRDIEAELEQFTMLEQLRWMNAYHFCRIEPKSTQLTISLPLPGSSFRHALPRTSAAFGAANAHHFH